MANLKNSLFSGSSPDNNSSNPSISYQFLTAVVKGKQNQWAICGANAASSSLLIFYNGARPSMSSYNPISKEGAIILSISSDNSNSTQGIFYEGVMTSSYLSNVTEDLVQANIITAKYTTALLTSGPKLTLSSLISLQATTPGYITRYIAHSGSTINT